VALVLNQLPYKVKLTSRATDSAQTGWLVGLTVTDTTGALSKRTTTINVPQNVNWEDFSQMIRSEIGIAMVVDAGGRAAFIDFLITNNVLLNIL
jgi:hypothetical protein